MNSSDEISENALMLETIFNNTHFMIAYMNKNFDFIRVNEAYAKKSDKTPDFFVGKNHFELYPHKGNENIFKRVVETGEPYFAYSMPLEHPELGIIYWDWVIQPVKEKSEVTGLLLSLTDVTEYKRNEENIHENQEKFMEELVENRANEMIMEQKEAANSILEAANLEIKELNQRISEIKNSNDEFKEIISKYENSKIENDESTGKQFNEIMEKQKNVENLLNAKELEVETLNQKIDKLEKSNDEFKEIISKYEDSKIENEEFIEKLIETHAKELEKIKEHETTPGMIEDQTDILNDAVIVLDNKLRIKTWNDAARRIYGWKKEEVTGKIAYELLKSDTNPIERLKILEHLRKNKYLTSKFVHYNKDSKPINIESNIKIKNDPNGRVIEYIMVNRDISKYKTTEKELDAKKLEIMQLNQKIIELQNTHEGFKEIISRYENSKDEQEDFIEELIEKHINQEKSLESKNSEIEELNQQTIELENVNNEFKEIILTNKLEIENLNRHVNELKKANEESKEVISNQISEIESLNEQINEIDESEENLEVLNDLKHSNAELEKFTDIVSHELQEPLKGISSFTQILAKRYKYKLDKDADEIINYIIEDSQRIQRMILGLSQYSRITALGKEFRETNSEEILKLALNNLHAEIGDNNAEITHDQLPKVTCDSGQLLQVFQNLIDNALKFRKKEIHPKINISSFEDEENSEYIFSVQDNGIGIESQYMDKIFEIFKKLNKTNYQGTGIGLSVAKGIIERHGGRIWAESDLGEGSTFYFTLSKS